MLCTYYNQFGHFAIKVFKSCGIIMFFLLLEGLLLETDLGNVVLWQELEVNPLRVIIAYLSLLRSATIDNREDVLLSVCLQSPFLSN